MKEIEKYDEKGNRIYWKDSIGVENWWEYDNNNDIIHYRNSFGAEYFYKYDDNNRQTEVTEQEFYRGKNEKYKTKNHK